MFTVKSLDERTEKELNLCKSASSQPITLVKHDHCQSHLFSGH